MRGLLVRGMLPPGGMVAVSALTQPAPDGDPESGAHAPGPFHVGQVLSGTFEITGVIGVGGMNAVYDALDRTLQRRVAVKAPLFAAYAQALAREAQALAAIRSPSFVTVHHVGSEDGVDYVVMERLFGETLEERLDALRVAHKQMGLAEVLELLTKIAEALSAAHRLGIAHRDVKPANIILTPDRVVFVDLGLFVPEVLVSPDNDVAGSAQYMAPEVLLHDVAPGGGPLVDLYALGVIAYELLTNVTPFTGDSTERVLANHVCAPIPDVAQVRSDVPSGLAALVTELLAKRAAERPSSAESVLWQLREIQSRHLHPPRALNVMVIDDEAHVRTALKRSLESAFPTLHVETTGDARHAIAGRTPGATLPDVVLVDLHMPEDNGVEVCMNVLSLPAGSRPIVVAMSAQAVPADLQVLRQLGVRHFVPKDAQFLSSMSSIIGELREERRAR